jgi:hypothetical protein
MKSAAAAPEKSASMKPVPLGIYTAFRFSSFVFTRLQAEQAITSRWVLLASPMSASLPSSIHFVRLLFLLLTSHSVPLSLIWQGCFFFGFFTFFKLSCTFFSHSTF